MQRPKQNNLNFSQTLKHHLTASARHTQHSQWLAENKNALDEYNRRIELRGTFSDGLRRF